jgi:hypothetical protein
MSLRADIENAIGDAHDELPMRYIARIADALMPLVERAMREAIDETNASFEEWPYDTVDAIVARVMGKGDCERSRQDQVAALEAEIAKLLKEDK